MVPTKEWRTPNIWNLEEAELQQQETTQCPSCQLRTIEDQNNVLGLTSPHFSCNIQIFGSKLAVNNVVAWLQSGISFSHLNPIDHLCRAIEQEILITDNLIRFSSVLDILYQLSQTWATVLKRWDSRWRCFLTIGRTNMRLKQLVRHVKTTTSKNVSKPLWKVSLRTEAMLKAPNFYQHGGPNKVDFYSIHHTP